MMWLQEPNLTGLKGLKLQYGSSYECIYITHHRNMFVASHVDVATIDELIGFLHSTILQTKLNAIFVFKKQRLVL